MKNVGIVFDKRSAREIDANGFLHVKGCNISKATVNPYLGKEIPNWEELGLQSDKIYQIYRPAEELAKAAASCNMIPLMDAHIEIDAMKLDDPEIAKHRVGSTGQAGEFKAPYLINDLVITNAAAIAAVDSKEQRELSCAYRYNIVMEPGEFEGTKFDGSMEDINFNHVALVEEGRAGPDVMVADDSSKLKEARVERIDRIKQAMQPGPWAKIAAVLAGDAKACAVDSPDPIDGFVDQLTAIKASITKQMKPGASDEDGKALDDCTSAIDLAVHHLLDVKEDDVAQDDNPSGINQYSGAGGAKEKAYGASLKALHASSEHKINPTKANNQKAFEKHDQARKAHNEAARVAPSNEKSAEHQAKSEEHKQSAMSHLKAGAQTHDRSVTADIAQREDVSPKRGESEYGKVKFADPKNKKYPLDTAAHVRSAASYFGMAKNRSQYSKEDQATIQSRITAAEKKFKIGAHAEGK